MDAETWHIPLRENVITIREALKSMESFKLDQTDVPFIIRFFENPKYMMLPGAVTLQSHDIIHVLLGRGLLPKDEAFVIGFTMGSTGQLTFLQKRIFRFITRFLYPSGYRFGPDELQVFESGLYCAEETNCPDLSKIDLSRYLDYTIRDARAELGIDVSWLSVEYMTERLTYDSIESQRLL